MTDLRLTSILFFALTDLLRSEGHITDDRGDRMGEDFNLSVFVRLYAGYPISAVKALREAGGRDPRTGFHLISVKDASQVWKEAKALVEDDEYTQMAIANASARKDWATVGFLARSAQARG